MGSVSYITAGLKLCSSLGLMRPDDIGQMPDLSPLCLPQVFYALERKQTIISYAGYHQLCRLILMYNFDIIRFNYPCTSIMLLL